MNASVIVDNLDIVRVPVFPAETDPPLVVDANAVLSCAIAPKLLQAIARWGAEVLHVLRCINDKKFTEHGVVELRREPPHRLSRKQPLRVTVSEALDHL